MTNRGIFVCFLVLAAPANRKKNSIIELGNKERFDKEQIGIKEPFPVTNLPFIS
jgi:hypothetical protein